MITDNGDLVNFSLTTGSVHDVQQIWKLTKNLENSEVYGDRGYISTKLEKELKKKSVTLITKVRSNMKPRATNSKQKFFLSKRGIIESAIDILKNEIQIEHTRHRSPSNFIANLLSGLLAYKFRHRKPSVKKSLLKPQKTKLCA